jgi:hypothetical protein
MTKINENNTKADKNDVAQQHNAEHQYVRQKVVEFDNELTFLAGKIDRTERDYLLFKEQVIAILGQLTAEIRKDIADTEDEQHDA